MTASIYWSPVKPGTALNGYGSGSDFVGVLELPRTLSDNDFLFLRGVMAGRPDLRGAIEELIDAIEKHGEIQVYATY